MQKSTQMAVMLSPSLEYRRLAARPAAGTWTRSLAGPAFFAGVLASVVSIGTTGVITPSLFASSVVCWSFVPILQVLNGLALMRGRTRDRRRGLELLFLAQAPWMLWLIGLAFAVTVAPHAQLTILLTAVVPAVWTWRILSAFCREVLGLPAREARRRVAVHALVTIALFLVYLQVTAGLVSRAVMAFAS